MGVFMTQPELPFEALDKTHFVNSQIGANLEFIVEGGSVTGFNMRQGSVTLDFKRKAVAK